MSTLTGPLGPRQCLYPPLFGELMFTLHASAYSVLVPVDRFASAFLFLTKHRYHEAAASYRHWLD